MSENEFWTRIPREHSAPNTPDRAETTPDTAPNPAESTRLAVPRVNTTAPKAVTPATVAAMDATRPLFASIHLVNELMTAVVFATIGCNVELRASPTAFIVPSTADWKSRNEPPIPASIARTVESA